MLNQKLKYSIILGCYEYIKDKISKDIKIVNDTDKDGNTPLILSAKHGRHEIAELLIKNGAIITAQNKDGISASQIAFDNNFIELHKYLSKLILDESKAKCDNYDHIFYENNDNIDAPSVSTNDEKKCEEIEDEWELGDLSAVKPIKRPDDIDHQIVELEALEFSGHIQETLLVDLRPDINDSIFLTTTENITPKQHKLQEKKSTPVIYLGEIYNNIYTYEIAQSITYWLNTEPNNKSFNLKNKFADARLIVDETKICLITNKIIGYKKFAHQLRGCDLRANAIKMLASISPIFIFMEKPYSTSISSQKTENIKEFYTNLYKYCTRHKDNDAYIKFIDQYTEYTHKIQYILYNTIELILKQSDEKCFKLIKIADVIYGFVCAFSEEDTDMARLKDTMAVELTNAMSKFEICE